jgi:ATP synthase in type III secretion protein N
MTADAALPLDTQLVREALRRVLPGGLQVRRVGQVQEAIGTVVRVTGLDVRVGDLCELRTGEHGQMLGEVVGLTRNSAVLMPFGPIDGLGGDTRVERLARGHSITAGLGLLGRVLDGFGRPIDGLGPLEGSREVPVKSAPPPPLSRAPIDTVMPTGVRAIDALATLGRGQRVGLFAPAGVGKSTLMGMLARGVQAECNVIALIGERGREVNEFLHDCLGPEGLARSVVVVATSDAPAMERAKAAHVATAIAEQYRDDHGLHVLLLMDSITRFARAMREIGLAAGEPPTRRGFPPSTFSELPKLLERAGCGAHGSVTAIYSVLMEDEESADPIAEEVRSILDGHLILSRAVAATGHYPAIDTLASLSRVMNRIATPQHRRAATHMRRLLARYKEVELLVQVGEFERGNDPQADEAVTKIEAIRAFLQQPERQSIRIEDTLALLDSLS